MALIFLTTVSYFFISFAAWGWGPFEARSLKVAPMMDWSWVMETARETETLELDCQSFIHHLHHFKKGQRFMSLMLDTYECEATHSKLDGCFPVPGVACVTDQGLPEVKCGSCPIE